MLYASLRSFRPRADSLLPLGLTTSRELNTITSSTLEHSMSSDSNTLRPKSLDEIQEAFTVRLGKHSFRLRSPLRFSRSAKPTEKLVMYASPAQGLRLQYQNNECVCELAGEKIFLQLADFEVKSELLDEEILYE